MPTRNTTGENTTYTFTGHLVNEEIPTNEQKKEIHIHIEHIENLDLTLQMQNGEEYNIEELLGENKTQQKITRLSKCQYANMIVQNND